MSVFEFSCPKCGRPRIIPSGSQKPSCPVCEPERLWLDAEAAYKKRQEEQ